VGAGAALFGGLVVTSGACALAARRLAEHLPPEANLIEA